MASIEADLLGGRPSLVEEAHRPGHYQLHLHILGGMIVLGLIPCQGRELAKLLIERFGSSEEESDD
jgi:hypothetical protein